MIGALPLRPMHQQLAAAMFSLAGGAILFGVWGPPHGYAKLEVWYPFLALSVGAVWLACQFVLLILLLERRRPVTRTRLGTLVLGAGVVSCLSLFTGFLLGWLALLLAPAGLLCGAITIGREIRAKAGNDARNLIGTVLCAGAIAFLMA